MPAPSNGVVLLDSSGKRVLRNAGKMMLGDGVTEACCCGTEIFCCPFYTCTTGGSFASVVLIDGGPFGNPGKVAAAFTGSWQFTESIEPIQITESALYNGIWCATYYGTFGGVTILNLINPTYLGDEVGSTLSYGLGCSDAYLATISGLTGTPECEACNGVWTLNRIEGLYTPNGRCRWGGTIGTGETPPQGILQCLGAWDDVLHWNFSVPFVPSGGLVWDRVVSAAALTGYCPPSTGWLWTGEGDPCTGVGGTPPALTLAST